MSARVQGPVAVNGSGGTTLSRTFAAQPTAGNLVVAFGACWNSPIPTWTYSDTAGNAYTEAVTNANADNARSEISYKANIATTATFTVTQTASASCDMALAINEYSGVATSPTVTTNSANGISTSLNTGAVAPSGDQMYVAVGTMAITTTITPTWTGATQEQEIESSGITNISVLDLAGSGSQTATWTIGASDKWSCCIAAFSDAVAPAGQPMTRRRGAIPGLVGGGHSFGRGWR